MKNRTIKRNKTIICCLVFLTIFLLMTFILVKNNFFIRTDSVHRNIGIEDVLTNMDNYADYFKDNHAAAQILRILNLKRVPSNRNQ